MAVTHNVFGPGLENILNGTINLHGDVIKVALMKQAYSPSESDEEWDNTHECDDADYTPGGEVLPITVNEINYSIGKVIISTSLLGGELIFTEEGVITAYYAVIYSATRDKLISWVDFDGEEEASGGEFKITWTAGEIIEFELL